MWVVSFTSYLHCMFSPHNVESAQNWVESSERIIWEQFFSHTHSLCQLRVGGGSPAVLRWSEKHNAYSFLKVLIRNVKCVLKLLLSFKEA